jgi:hypothetical protein
MHWLDQWFLLKGAPRWCIENLGDPSVLSSPISSSQAQLVLNFHVSTCSYQVLDDLYSLEGSCKHERSLVGFVCAVDVNALGQKRAQAVKIAGGGSAQEFEGADLHESG